MPLLKFGKKALSASGRGMGRMVSSPAGIAALGIGAGALGLANSIGPEAVDFAMEGAFGDENADRYFTGMDLSARTLIGQATGGILGGVIRSTNPTQQYMMNPRMPDPMITGIGGTALGAVGGGVLGGVKKGFKGALIGTTLGAIVGGTLGTGVSAAAPIGYMKQNRQFFTESPYTSLGSSQAQALNATGDIVLGMHNSRRGY